MKPATIGIGEGQLLAGETPLGASPSALSEYRRLVSCESTPTSPVAATEPEATLIGEVAAPSKEAPTLSSTCSHRSTSKLLTSKQVVHPLQDREQLLSCIQLLDAKRFASLPTPLPRVQDVPAEYFKSPAAGDQVISVSHAWQNQAHPDPSGMKAKVLSQILSTVGSDVTGGHGNKDHSVLLFFDFVSIPQSPFHAGQPPRSDEEKNRFRAALSCMHEMYFFSDRIIHLPWEPCKVLGEGVEYSVPIAALAGADFAQRGRCLQISALPCTSATARRPDALGSRQPHLFDEVLAVDDEPVTTLAQLNSLLDASARFVRLRSYPFGVSNSIPADARGWIFLERFITMVKCAMMDEETAKKVVITPSSSIFHDIMDGANRLRAASLRDRQMKGSSELKEVLDAFTRDLQTKQFSPTSTDKLEVEGGAMHSEDRNVVCGIMREFASHLARDWDREAAKQRRLSQRLTAAVVNFMEWDCFSEEYAAKLAIASKEKPWAPILCCIVPLAPCAIALLTPYPRPDEGWRSQLLWLIFGDSLICLLLLIVFPVFLAHAVSAHVGWTQLWRFSAWVATVTAIVLGFHVTLFNVWDTFPLPVTHFLGIPLAGLFVPLLYFAFSPDQRSSTEFRSRLLWAFSGLQAITTVFSLGFPLLNATLARVSQGWQALLVCAYLLSKLGFEAAAVHVSRRLGADTMPYFIIVATVSYQVNMCLALSMAASWVIVAEQICFDVLENLYHLWSASRADSARREQYIVSSLVLRQFTELFVPVQFLIIYSLMAELRPENSDLVCRKQHDQVRKNQFVLMVDILVEFVVSSLTHRLLVRRGHSPLSLLQGLVATRLQVVLLFATGMLLFILTNQHSHWGMDFSFQWLWLHEDASTWVCGLTWMSAP